MTSLYDFGELTLNALFDQGGGSSDVFIAPIGEVSEVDHVSVGI